MKKVLFIFLLAFAVYLTGCTDDEVVNHGYYNTPVVSSALDAFAYSITADTYTSIAAYNLSFTSDSVACSFVITNYYSGISSVRIKDSSGAVIYVDTLQGNGVSPILITKLQSVPQRFEIDFDHFTGKINFALAKSSTNWSLNISPRI